MEADTKTKYRIWSTTKMYTAIMIMQLIEEGKLTLTATLDDFYPQIPNAAQISIKDMLRHRSGIHDFTQNTSYEDWDANIHEPMTEEFMVNLISSYRADFRPDIKMQYSNSNYLLLGYILEALDDDLYENILHQRITSRIGLSNTHFSNSNLDTLANKALSYRFEKEWQLVDEGKFSGSVPGGAGGILSTAPDMVRMIEALFEGQLISRQSLTQMIEGDEFYRLGITKTDFGEKEAFGHTGGNKASESFLYFFPEDKLAIAYCSNGAMVRKEKVLEYVLKIVDDRPFAVSMNRKLLGTIIFAFSLLVIGVIHFKSKYALNMTHPLFLGFPIFVIFWGGTIISGFLMGDYNHVKDNLIDLAAFYSNSGTFMSAMQFIIVLFSIFFAIVLIKFCKSRRLNMLPVSSLLFLILSMGGAALFPPPHSLTPLFANLIILSVSGPILATFLWRQIEGIKWVSIISFLLMFSSIALLILRSSYPVFVGEHFGLIQRVLYVGITFWLGYVSYSFRKKITE
jgi:CubicO group peptidase (beta-lactamase class C family)